MPVDRFYCEMTPQSQMGFSQRSTCKALGLLPRTSSAHFGEYIVSDQYKSKSRSRQLSRSKSKSKSRQLSKSKSKSKSRQLSKSKSNSKSKQKHRSRSKTKSRQLSKKCGVCSS